MLTIFQALLKFSSTIQVAQGTANDWEEDAVKESLETQADAMLAVIEKEKNIEDEKKKKEEEKKKKEEEKKKKEEQKKKEKAAADKK